MPLGAGSIQRLENFIDGLLEIPDLREDAVAGLISGYVDNLVQGNEEALAQTEKQLEEMGAHIVETVVTDTELVDEGNFPLWYTNFFPNGITQGRFSKILDFDTLRLGRKVMENNPNIGSFDFC